MESLFNKLQEGKAFPSAALSLRPTPSPRGAAPKTPIGGQTSLS